MSTYFMERYEHHRRHGSDALTAVGIALDEYQTASGVVFERDDPERRPSKTYKPREKTRGEEN